MPPVKKPASAVAPAAASTATPAAAPAKKAAAPAPTPAPASAKPEKKKVDAVAAPAVAETEVVAVESPMEAFAAKIASLASLLKETQAALKVLTKSYDALAKTAAKAQKKKESARQNPSGFSKPAKISEELCTFLGLPAGSEVSRTQTTRLLTAYIREKNLANPTNRRFILPNDALRKLLRVPVTEELSYFNLQKYLRPHYIKAVVA